MILSITYGEQMTLFKMANVITGFLAALQVNTNTNTKSLLLKYHKDI